jgi:hypothetical protein
MRDAALTLEGAMMKGNSRRKEVERAVFLVVVVEKRRRRSYLRRSKYLSLSFFELPAVALFFQTPSRRSLFCYFVTICSPSRAKALSATVAQSWLIYVKHLRSEAESNLI